MSEYLSNLGHAVEGKAFQDQRLFHQETTERNRAMDGRMKDALQALGYDPNGDDPRAVATTVLNGMTDSDRPRMITLAAALWHPDVKAGNAEIPEELGVLTPDEVTEIVTKRLARLAQSNPSLALRWLRDNPKTGPGAYIEHMDASGHGSSTAESIRRLRDDNELDLRGANMEVGSGPGNIAAHLIKRRMVPAGNLHLVDSNPQWLGHAIPLVNKMDPERPVKIHPADAATVDPHEEIGTVWTALTLQWFTNPRATIDNLQKVIARDGAVFFIGETPTNATANTPRGLHGGLDIGFSHGAFSYEQVCEMFTESGFVPERNASIISMAMPTPSPEFLDSLSPEDRKKAELMLAYSDHLMVGTAWKKA